jgi:hypothetical protein
LPAVRSDDFSGGEDGGAIEPALLERLAQIDGGEVGVVADVADGGNAGVEEDAGSFEAAERAKGGVFVKVAFVEVPNLLAGGDVRVRVHDAGHHPGVREVDDDGVLGDGDIRADFRDLRVLHEDDLVFRDCAMGGIDQVAGADGDGLREGSRSEKQEEQHDKRLWTHGFLPEEGEV